MSAQDWDALLSAVLFCGTAMHLIAADESMYLRAMYELCMYELQDKPQDCRAISFQCCMR